MYLVLSAFTSKGTLFITESGWLRAEVEGTPEHRASKVIDFNKGLKYYFFLKIIHVFNN